MPRMVAPDGTEKDVSAGEVAYWKSKGAKLAGPAVLDASLIPLMPGGPTVRDASAALPFAGMAAGGAMGGPIGAGIGTGVGELGRQAILGESPDLKRASIEAFLGLAGAGAPKAIAAGAKIPAVRGAWAGAKEFAKDIPFLRRAGKAGRVMKAARKAAQPPKPAAPSKVAGSIKPAPKPKPSAKPKPAAKAAPADPLVPIEVQGKPGAMRIAKQKGKSGRQLAASQKGQAAAAANQNPAPLDAASRLELSLEFEKEMARRGFNQQQKQALRRGAMEYLQQGGAQ